MKNDCLLRPWIRRFLLEHLVAERNLSRITQRSYRRPNDRQRQDLGWRSGVGVRRQADLCQRDQPR